MSQEWERLSREKLMLQDEVQRSQSQLRSQYEQQIEIEKWVSSKLLWYIIATCITLYCHPEFYIIQKRVPSTFYVGQNVLHGLSTWRTMYTDVHGRIKMFYINYCTLLHFPWAWSTSEMLQYNYYCAVMNAIMYYCIVCTNFPSKSCKKVIWALHSSGTRHVECLLEITQVEQVAQHMHLQACTYGNSLSMGNLYRMQQTIG